LKTAWDDASTPPTSLF